MNIVKLTDQAGSYMSVINGNTCFTYEQLQKFVDIVRAEALAEPVKQEPVAHYKDAPHTIYLQTGCDDPEDCECSFNEWGDTTWCADQIHDTDIPYIRADYAAPLQQADLTVSDLDAIIEKHYDDEMDLKAMILDGIAAFKEKNK